MPSGSGSTWRSAASKSSRSRPQFGLTHQFPGSVPLSEKTDDSGHRRVRRLVVIHKRLAPAFGSSCEIRNRIVIFNKATPSFGDEFAQDRAHHRVQRLALRQSRPGRPRAPQRMNANNDNGPEPDIITKSMRPEAVRDLLAKMEYAQWAPCRSAPRICQRNASGS
jgi:hypothetical protein